MWRRVIETAKDAAASAVGLTLGRRPAQPQPAARSDRARRRSARAFRRVRRLDEFVLSIRQTGAGSRGGFRRRLVASPTTIWRWPRAAWAARRAVAAAPYVLEEGLLLTPKDVATDHAVVGLSAAVHHDGPVLYARLQVHDAVTGQPLGEPASVELVEYDFRSEIAYTGQAGAPGFFHAHHRVELAAAGGELEVRASVVDRAGTSHEAACRVRPLPARLAAGERLEVFAASCFDIDTDVHDELALAAERRDAAFDVKLFLGDQVYLDAPWWTYGLLARNAPRTYALSEYWATWGKPGGTRRDGTRRQGLGPLLRRGGNWFLPDDHELWNNWPHVSVTAKHSWANIRNGLVGWAARRRVARKVDALRGRPVPAELRRSIDYRKVFEPVRADEWGRWGRSAFELFNSFQTPLPVASGDGSGDFESSSGEAGEPKWLRRVDGWADADPAELTRKNVAMQEIRVDPVRIVLLDTRTRRTRSHRAVGAQFVDPETLAELFDLAGQESCEVLVLALAQPVLVRPAHLDRGDRAGKLAFDRGMQHYYTQFHEFWTGLVAARRGRPTVLLGGDVHHSFVRSCAELGLVEICASPMSLVAGLGPTAPLRRVARSVTGAVAGRVRARLGENGHLIEEIFTDRDGHVWQPPHTKRPLRELRLDEHARLEDRPNAYAALRFSVLNSGVIRLVVTLQPVGHAAAKRVIVDLDARQPARAVEVIEAVELEASGEAPAAGTGAARAAGAGTAGWSAQARAAG